MKDLSHSANKSGQASKNKNWRKFKPVKVEKNEKRTLNMIDANDDQDNLRLVVRTF